MTTTEDIRAIFSILHDGCISAWSGNKDSLTLTIECQYLAQCIDKSFDRFYVELTQVNDLYLSTWPNPSHLPTRMLSEPKDIFKVELEILSADVKDENVVIACNQHNTGFDYCGGDLVISCQSIKVFDQNRREMFIGRLEEICKTYWDEWSKK